MNFLTRADLPPSRYERHAGAMLAWRAAEQLVRERWQGYRAAGREDRAGAFAAFVFALNAEDAAANELLAITHLRRAA